MEQTSYSNHIVWKKIFSGERMENKRGYNYDESWEKVDPEKNDLITNYFIFVPIFVSCGIFKIKTHFSIVRKS